MVERLAAGEVRMLARAASIVEDEAPGAEDLLAHCAEVAAHKGHRARRIGITGPPGAGKSTLADQMIRMLRAKGERVAVLAVDPTSPFTGGALLGDRIRMQGFTGDAGVYIRSMASRGAMGGLARKADAVCRVLEAAGFDTVLIETVGVGQDEVEIARLAEVVLLVLVPGMGDDVQSLKAGVMEIADLYVVNKSDQPGADRVESEIVAMQSLAVQHAAWVPPVVRTVASSGAGVAELLEAIERCVAQRDGVAQQWDGSPMGRAMSPRSAPGNPEDLAALEEPRLDHLGIAVKSIDLARVFYELLGARVTHEETVEHEQVRTAMLPVGESRIELLEPTAEDSTIGRFLARRGEGLHHVALRVSRIDERFAQMQAAGTRLASDRVRVGAGGHRYFFVHPASTGGVLLELVGE